MPDEPDGPLSAPRDAPEPSARAMTPPDTAATPVVGPADTWEVATRDPALPVPYRPGPVALPAPPSAASPVRLLLAGADVTLDAVLAALGATDPRVRQAGDTLLGVAWTGYRTGSRVAEVLVRPALPLARAVADPPLVPRGWRPAALAERAAAAWQGQRAAGRGELARARDVTVPSVVDAAVEPVDLTRLVLDDVQLDVLAEAVLSELDLTEVVLTQVDLKRVAEAVLDQLDLTSIARERIDLVDIAEEVIDAVDLPEIIRGSTGSVASESVRSVRMQSIHADDRVQQIVDRLLTRRKQRSTAAPAGAAESDDDTTEQR